MKVFILLAVIFPLAASAQSKAGFKVYDNCDVLKDSKIMRNLDLISGKWQADHAAVSRQLGEVGSLPAARRAELCNASLGQSFNALVQLSNDLGKGFNENVGNIGQISADCSKEVSDSHKHVAGKMQDADKDFKKVCPGVKATPLGNSMFIR